MWGSLTGFAEPLGGLIGYLAVHEQVIQAGNSSQPMHCPWELGSVPPVLRHPSPATSSRSV